MSGEIKKFLWANISQAPSKPGIYAWYYTPEITDRDISNLINEIGEEEDILRGSELVKSFFMKRLFDLFREDDYTAKISGPLKPKYSGTLEHEVGVSQGLTDRIRDNPEKIESLINDTFKEYTERPSD